MLNSPAASAAPVPPAHTSACARPSATALAACTIEASGVGSHRARRVGALGDRHRRVHHLHAAVRCRSPSWRRRARTAVTRAPLRGRHRRAGRTSAGPRSAPLQSTATTGCVSGSERRRARSTRRELRRRRARGRGRGRSGRDDLAAGVGAADRADAVRAARAVALRARVHGGRADLVLRAALGGAAVRLLFLGDGHRAEGYQPASGLAAMTLRASARAASPSADRASLVVVLGAGLVEVGGAHRDTARRSPRGRAPWRAAPARTRRAPRPPGRASRLARTGSRAPRRRPAGRPRARPPRSRRWPCFRQRMHGSCKRRCEAQPAARSRGRSCARRRAHRHRPGSTA